MMKPSDAVKSIVYCLSQKKVGYWAAPSGIFELVGKPKLKKMKISSIDDDILAKINKIYEELIVKYGI